MLSFARLLLGLLLPASLVLALFTPASVLVRVEPVDWTARYEKAKAESRGEGFGLMALARSFRKVPGSLEAFVEEETAGRLIRVGGDGWGRVADGVSPSREGRPPGPDWVSRRGRPGSLHEDGLFFGLSEAPFDTLAREGGTLTASDSSFAYLAVDGGGGEARYLGLTLLSLGDVYGSAPLRLVFPWRHRWPLAFAAASALFLAFLWPVLPRRAVAPYAACSACAKPVLPGARHCAACGAAVAAPPPAPPLPLAWEVRVPLIRNPFFLGDGAWLVAVVSAVMLAIMGGISLASRNGALLPLLTLMLLVVGGLTLLGVLISVGLDLVGHTERVQLDEDGALVSTSRAARAIGRAAAVANVVGGVLAGRPGNVGVGLIAGSTLDRGMAWSEVREARLYPTHHVIELRESWPAPCRLNCGDAETYVKVAAVVAERVLMAGGTLSRPASVIGWTFRGVVLAVLASTLAYLLFA